MAITQTLQLKFVTEVGSLSTITLDNPKDELTPAEVTTAMDQIIAKNIFNSSGGDYTAKDSAIIIERESTVLYDAGA